MGSLLIGQQHNSRGTQEKNFSNLFLLILKKKRGKKEKRTKKKEKERKKKRRKEEREVETSDENILAKVQTKNHKQTEESYMRSETS